MRSRPIRAISPLLAAALVAGCGTKPAPPPQPPVVPPPVVEPPPPEPVEPPPPPPRMLPEVLRIEAERDTGAIPDLASTAAFGEPEETRAAAVRGLGRIGTPAAITALRKLWNETPAVRQHIADAVAIAGATEMSPDLVAFFFRGSTKEQALLVVRALGRMGDADSQRALAYGAKAPDAALRAEALLALGNHGQRKLAVADKAIEQIVDALDDADASVRYAASYALLKLPGDQIPEGAFGPMTANIADADADVRAMAIRALARWQPQSTISFVEGRLDDADWRVRVEAVRAMSTDEAPTDTRAALARWVAAQKPDVLDGPGVHAVVEALTRLRKHATEKGVRAAADEWFAKKLKRREKTKHPAVAVDTVHCLAAAIRAHGARKLDEVLGCGVPKGKGWPAFKRRELAAVVVGEGAGGDTTLRLAALKKLYGDDDPRVRAAAITAALQIDDVTVIFFARRALEDKDLLVVGSALEAIAANERRAASVGDAVVERARSADLSQPDVILTFLDFFAKAKPEGARSFAYPFQSHPNRTVRAKARETIAAIDGRDPGETSPSGKNPLPPADPASVRGRQVRWLVSTTRGTFKLELDPAHAPWSVAALTKLAQDGIYDGTLWHRVVPDFVVQGGDPSGSGWGGPGFTLPAEPSVTPYDRGAVGIADAGLDTGGSQWFVTHTRTPHLDARYTVLGRVVTGQEVVDTLLVGDRIEKITVVLEAIAPEPPPEEPKPQAPPPEPPPEEPKPEEPKPEQPKPQAPPPEPPPEEPKPEEPKPEEPPPEPPSEEPKLDEPNEPDPPDPDELK